MDMRELENVKTKGQLVPFIKHMTDNFSQVSISGRSGLFLSYIDQEHGLYQLNISGSETSLAYTQRRLADSDDDNTYVLGRTFKADYLTRHGEQKLSRFLHDKGFYL